MVSNCGEMGGRTRALRLVGVLQLHSWVLYRRTCIVSGVVEEGP